MNILSPLQGGFPHVGDLVKSFQCADLLVQSLVVALSIKVEVQYRNLYSAPASVISSGI